jgi:hypothetical protein
VTAERRLVLRRTDDGATVSVVEVVVTESGDLVMEGQDVGEAPREFFGDSDYEYWVTVRGSGKDAVLLRLLADRFGPEGAPSSAFMEWLTANGIEYELSTF